jgi:hypothetical protein
MTRKLRTLRLVCLLAITCPVYSSPEPQALATQTPAGQTTTQSERDVERSTIKSEEFVRARPGGNSSQPAGYHYRIAATNKPHQRKRPGSHTQRFTAGNDGPTKLTIGVTIGRARRATEAERLDESLAKVRSRSGADFVLERMTHDVAVSHGTLMQMMIEYLAGPDATNRVGYLYVINRVQYSNGTYSEPRLIFPTRRTYGGDSRVLPGKVVILPDPQRLWEISRNSSREQAFETYLIIISSAPLKDSDGQDLEGDHLTETPIKLDEKLVAGWIRNWGAGELRADLTSSTTKYLTQREQAASGNTSANERDTSEQSSDLTQADLPPQNVFRKSVNRSGKMLVTIKLPFKASAITARSEP